MFGRHSQYQRNVSSGLLAGAWPAGRLERPLRRLISGADANEVAVGHFVFFANLIVVSSDY
jgi:hypothetical protein